MIKLDSQEFVGTTFYTIQKIREYKQGGNALILYFAYQEQNKIQQTNQSRSTDKFMMKKLNRSNDKLSSAKKVLKELGLIDIIQGRDKDGKMTTCYVKTNFIINEQKIRNSQITYKMQELPPESENRQSGKSLTNALSNKTKCLKNNNNNIHTSIASTLLSSFGLSIAMIEEWFEYKKTLDTILADCRGIKYISAELGIEPVYNKQTINAIDIIFNKGYSVDEVIEWIKENRADDVSDFQELIREDYYLPEEIDK